MANVTVIPAKPMQELKGFEATAKVRGAWGLFLSSWKGR